MQKCYYDSVEIRKINFSIKLVIYNSRQCECFVRIAIFSFQMNNNFIIIEKLVFELPVGSVTVDAKN